MPIARWRECAYGTAEWGLSAVETFVRLHLLFYMTNVCKIEAALAGLLVSAGVFWDGLIDPLAGWLSDRTRSRFGPRSPYIFAGMLGLPLTLGLLFLPILQVPDGGQEVWLFLLYLLVNTAMTLISVPHAALAGDLSRDESVRTRLFAWRYLFTTLGLLSGIAIPGFFLTQESGLPYLRSAFIIGGIALFACAATLLGTRGVSVSAPQGPKGSAWAAFRNRPFLILLVAMILATIGQAINSSLALYYYRLTLGLEEKDLQLILLVFTVIIVLSIVAWNLLSHRFSKKNLLAFGVGSLGVLGAIAYPLFPRASIVGPMLMAVIGGLLVGSVFLLEVMVADTVDASGQKAQDYGTYFGIWKLGTKLSRAIAIGLSGVLLSGIGFHPEGPQSPDTLRAIAYLFGPGVGIFFVLGAALILFYPLDDRARSKEA